MLIILVLGILVDSLVFGTHRPSHPPPPGAGRLMGGHVVWLTGLPSAGKSTIAAAVAERLADEATPCRCSTATRCAPSCAPTWATAAPTATRTCAASATWPTCWPATV